MLFKIVFSKTAHIILLCAKKKQQLFHLLSRTGFFLHTIRHKQHHFFLIQCHQTGYKTRPICNNNKHELHVHQRHKQYLLSALHAETGHKGQMVAETLLVSRPDISSERLFTTIFHVIGQQERGIVNTAFFQTFGQSGAHQNMV